MEPDEGVQIFTMWDANETFFVVDDVLGVDWVFSINNKQTIEVVQKEVFLVVDQCLWK